MSDQQMDKQEPATPYKLQEARKKGQIGRSLELVSFASLLVLLTGLLATLPALAHAFVEQTSWWLENAHFLAKDWAVYQHHADRFSTSLLYFLGPIVIAGITIAIAVGIAHAGVVFSSFPLKADFSKLNPANGLKRVFSRKNLIELAKLLVKLSLFIAVAVVLWPNMAGSLADMLNLTPGHIAASWRTLGLKLSVGFLVVFALSALFDLWFSKRDFARQMRMSRRDLKDEHRRREGDPEIKAKRRRSQLELMKKLAGMKNIKNADVIVTNPTHVAVALRYRPNEMALPITLALGRGVIAKTIIAIARRHRIPVLRRPPLARALYRRGSPGGAIPLDQQTDVATVYRWVISLPGNKVLVS